MSQTALVVETEEHVCCTCGVGFTMPLRLGEEKRSTGGSFFCPNGHSLTYSMTEIKRLRSETAKLREQFFAEQRSHENTQREMEKIKKRVSKGVCPCCQRHFVNVNRHMKTKHPDFAVKK